MQTGAHLCLSAKQKAGQQVLECIFNPNALMSAGQILGQVLEKTKKKRKEEDIPWVQ